MTGATIKNLLTLHPVMTEKFIQLRKRCQEHKEFDSVYTLICTCGWRSMEDQQKAFDSGHSKARPGTSFHNYFLAFDVAPMGRASKEIFWKDDKAWDIIHDCSMGLDLSWGGVWQTIVDKPHFQLSGFSIKELSDNWNKFDNKSLFFEWITTQYLMRIK